MNKHTKEELKQIQMLSLDSKIQMTRQRIKGWVDEFGEGGVYVSFSGGKDSTVLLDIVRKDYPDMLAVFCDTGLEYPEIREFVKGFSNVEWLRPKMMFKEVIRTFGYPFISKEVSGAVYYAKKELEKVKLEHELNGNSDDIYAYMKAKGIKPQMRTKVMMGELEHKHNKEEFSVMYDRSKWKFLLDAPFDISSKCCHIMKRDPLKEFHKRTGMKPITAQMATESRPRLNNWLQHGCNYFDGGENAISNPMSFWSEQDVLAYIKTRNLPICSVYGDIVYKDDDGMEYENSIFDESMHLVTTGCDRTGCMFCAYGCHVGKKDRFEKMKQTHPKQYEYIMKPLESGGLGYKSVIDWLNEHGNLNIRY